MKKLLFSVLCLILTMFLYLPVNAQENKKIAEGYNSEGIHYTVYEVETITTIERTKGDSLNVIREFYYTGIVQPPTVKQWTEQNNGITYSGTLKLYAFTFKDGNTIATYKGTLTAIN